jgi:hypothetical protein
MATRRKEIDGEELAGWVRAVLRDAGADALSLAELRASLADEEGYAVQACPGELAGVLNGLIRSGEVLLSAGDTDVPVFTTAPVRRG